VLAGMVAQSASGYSLAALIRDSILTPLNLNSTFIDVEEPITGTIAHRWWNTIDYHDTSRVGLNSAVGYAGSIFSTASDMVLWYDALFTGQVINQSSMNELTTFVATSNPNYQYGLGLSRDKTQGFKYWGHGGSTWGYKSKMMYDTCLNVAVAGLTNSFPSGMDGVTFLLYRVVKNHIPGCVSAITGSDTVCRGDNSVTYTVTPVPNATSYLWSFPSGVTGNSITHSISLDFGQGAGSGIITVTGINNYGAGGSSSVYVTVNPIPATPAISMHGDTLTSSAPHGNQWYNSSGIIVGADDSTYIINATDDYYCIVTLSGCSSDTSVVIHAIPTGITSTFAQNGLKIFPNPTSSQTTFQTDILLTNATLVVTDCYGHTVAQIKNISGRSFVLQRENLASGLYFVQLIHDNQLIAIKKLIITD
jgi:CubicO group peptidase (beta-lactamase class C family)